MSQDNVHSGLRRRRGRGKERAFNPIVDDEETRCRRSRPEYHGRETSVDAADGLAEGEVGGWCR